MRLILVIIVLFGFTTQIPIKSGRLEKYTTGRVQDYGKGTYQPVNPPGSSFTELLESYGEEDEGRDGRIKERVPMSGVIAFSCAATLLASYLLFLIVCLLYSALRSSGRIFVRVDRREEHRTLIPEVMPAIQKPNTLPEMPKGSFAQILSKGKEKLKPPGGKPVIYPSNF